MNVSGKCEWLQERTWSLPGGAPGPGMRRLSTGCCKVRAAACGHATLHRQARPPQAVLSPGPQGAHVSRAMTASCLLSVICPHACSTRCGAQVAGRVLLPGAGMLEAAQAACWSLAGDAGRPALVLTHCSIPAALQLSQVHAALGPLLTSQAVKPTCAHRLARLAGLAASHFRCGVLDAQQPCRRGGRGRAESRGCRHASMGHVLEVSLQDARRGPWARSQHRRRAPAVAGSRVPRACCGEHRPARMRGPAAGWRQRLSVSSSSNGCRHARRRAHRRA